MGVNILSTLQNYVEDKYIMIHSRKNYINQFNQNKKHLLFYSYYICSQIVSNSHKISCGLNHFNMFSYVKRLELTVAYPSQTLLRVR